MIILMTGASGFLGSLLAKKLLEKGHRIYSVSRHPPELRENLAPLVGDITEKNFGLSTEVFREHIDACYHLAGIHRLGEDKDGSIWLTNVAGTRNVLEFCLHHDIPRLYFTSTAYTWECNTYGLSKIQNEREIKEYSEKYGLKTTIFKPSIIMGTAEHPYPGHFSQFVSAVIKIHQRAEVIRRKVEGTLRLPVIEPVFRIKGNPEGTLNLVTVDAVAEAMANIDAWGTFWLTNPDPQTLRQLVEWVGKFIMVDMRIEPEFRPTPIEAAFQKMATAFEPYLQGDDFPSDLKDCPITKEFIHETIKRSIF